MHQVEMRGFLYGLVYVSAQKERFPSRQDNTIKATVRALHQLKLQRRSLFQRLLALSVFLRECNAHSRIDGLPASNNPTRTPLATCPRWRILDTCRNKYHRRRYICALVRSDPYRFTRTIGLIMAGSVRMTAPSLHTRGHQCCQDRKQKGINASNLFPAFDPIRNG